MDEDEIKQQEERDAQKKEEESARKTEEQYNENKSSEKTSAEEEQRKQDDEDVKKAKEAGVDVEEFERTKKALAKANKEAEQRRHKLNEWDELGVDPDKVKAMLQEQRDAEIKKAEEEGRYQELLDKIKTESSEKLTKAEEKVNNMQRKLESYLVDKNLTEAIAAEDGIPKLLQGIAKQYVSVIEDDTGDYKTVILDEDGQPRKNEKGEPMNVRELVKSFKEDPDLQYAFKAPKTSGAGTDSQAASTPPSKKPGPKPRRGDMSPKEQRDFVQKYGYEEFSKLPR